MQRPTVIVALSLLGFYTYAQAKTCTKGIACGGTCISASYTCHIGTPTTPPPSLPTPQTLTSPPLPVEPSGTYLQWSATDSTVANQILDARPPGVPVTVGYSKLREQLSTATVRQLVDQVLQAETQGSLTLRAQHVGSTWYLLARRPDGTRGVLVVIVSTGSQTPDQAYSIRASGFSASAPFELPGFVSSDLKTVLANLEPSTAKTTTSSTSVTTTTAVGGLDLTLNPDNMFVDPGTGNLVIPAQCASATIEFRPKDAFSAVVITERTNQLMNYSLDVLVDGKLRYTDDSTMGKTSYGAITLPVPVGQQVAGALVTFTFKPVSTALYCKGVITLGLKTQ